MGKEIPRGVATLPSVRPVNRSPCRAFARCLRLARPRPRTDDRSCGRHRDVIDIDRRCRRRPRPRGLWCAAVVPRRLGATVACWRSPCLCRRTPHQDHRSSSTLPRPSSVRARLPAAPSASLRRCECEPPDPASSVRPLWRRSMLCAPSQHHAPARSPSSPDRQSRIGSCHCGPSITFGRRCCRWS